MKLSSFYFRMTAPIICIFFLGLVGVSQISHQMDRLQAPNLENLVPEFNASAPFYSKTLTLWSSFPEQCKSHQETSEFQVKQCAQLRGYFLKLNAVGFLPFLLMILSFYLLRIKFLSFHKTLKSKLEKEFSQIAGKVSSKTMNRFDGFGWFYCLRPIEVELKKGVQVTAYIGLDSEMPKPGESVSLVKIGKFDGQLRFFAKPYNPYVVVVRGS